MARVLGCARLRLRAAMGLINFFERYTLSARDNITEYVGALKIMMSLLLPLPKRIVACIDVLILVHVVAQTTWLTSTVADTNAYGAMLFACMLKASIVLQLGYVLSKRVQTVAHVVLDALCYCVLFIDYRVHRVFGAHLLSPMMLAMSHVPSSALRENLSTDMMQFVWAGTCTMFFAVVLVAIVDAVLAAVVGPRLCTRLSTLKVRRATRFVTFFVTILRGALLFNAALTIHPIHHVATAMQNHREHQREQMVQFEADWCNMETLRMTERPNIVLTVFDSGRYDMFDEKTFPMVHATIRQLGPQRCRKWSNHYSNGVQSDEGHAALIYSVLPTRDRLQQLEKSNATSWPLEVLRAHGYTIHGISSSTFEYCWALSANCTMHKRVFDVFEKAPTDYGVAQKDLWTARRAARLLAGDGSETSPNPTEPYVLVVYLDATHYPYLYPNRYEQYVPVASISDIWRFMKSGSNEEQVARGVRNRYRNAASYVDALVAEYIMAPIEQYINEGKTYFFLTSDHGEFLLDRGERIGHTVNEYYEEQTHVPALFCAASVVEHVHAHPVSGHVDVLPTILNAAGLHLPQHSVLPGRSMYRQNRTWTFSTYPWSNTVLLTDGTLKVWTDCASDDGDATVVTNMRDHSVPRDTERIVQLCKQWRQASALPLPCASKNSWRDRQTTVVAIRWMGNDADNNNRNDENNENVGIATSPPLCLDRMNPSQGSLHLYACWSSGWNQRWRYNATDGGISMSIPDGEIEHLVAREDKAITHAKQSHTWEYNEQTRQLVGDDRCLTATSGTRSIAMAPCSQALEQRWALDVLE